MIFTKSQISCIRLLLIAVVALLPAGELGRSQIAHGQRVAGETVSQSRSQIGVIPGNVAGKSGAAGTDNDYRIGPGDELNIEIYNRAQLSRAERVDGRGMISMPLLDEQIRAACRTESELANEIARLYREHDLLRNPAVFVTVKDFQSQPVAVIGSVNQPGRFILRRRVRLLELLVFFAGGPNPNAGSRVQILSTVPMANCEQLPPSAAAKTPPDENTEGTFVTYDVGDVLAGKESANPYVHQGEIINVPAIQQVYVIGNVARPSPIQISGTVTLSRALAMVGGILPNSKKEKIRISREVPGSNNTAEIVIDLKSADKSKGADFPLQSGDIVEVSASSGFQTVLKQLLIPTASSLPYRFIP